MNDPLSPLFHQAIVRSRGPGVRIRAVTRRENPNATLFPTEIVHLSLSDGSDLEIFLKHLTHEEVQHPDKLGPEIEVRVYRDWFDGVPGLAVPAFLGSGRIDGTDGFYLLLEHVPGRLLKHCPVPDWCTAARRLGELHRRFRSRADDVAGASCLLEMDARYYEEWADRARAAASAPGPELGRLLDQALAGYEDFASRMAGQPTTLVHNDLSSRNVIVDSRSTPPRIAFVDWETAGLGCGLVDLVHMKYNRLDRDADRAVCSAYLEGLEDPGLSSADGEAVQGLLDTVELHFTLYRIAHSAGWGETTAQLTRRVERAVAVRKRLG